MAEISVQVLDQQWIEALPDCEMAVRAAADAALQRLEISDPTLELSLVLADDETVQNLNRDYRLKDLATNVLAFPAAESQAPDAPRLLGDVIVARETLTREAKAQSKTLQDHLQHLVVHGVLHLLNFDHDTEESASKMEQLETRILERLGVRDPYEMRFPSAMEMSRG